MLKVGRGSSSSINIWKPLVSPKICTDGSHVIGEKVEGQKEDWKVIHNIFHKFYNESLLINQGGRQSIANPLSQKHTKVRYRPM